MGVVEEEEQFPVVARKETITLPTGATLSNAGLLDREEVLLYSNPSLGMRRNGRGQKVYSLRAKDNR